MPVTARSGAAVLNLSKTRDPGTGRYRREGADPTSLQMVNHKPGNN